MRLELLYPNFADKSPEEQTLEVRKYRVHRDADLQSYCVDKATKPKRRTKKVKKAKKALEVSAEELALLKKLGITSADLGRL